MASCYPRPITASVCTTPLRAGLRMKVLATGNGRSAQEEARRLASSCAERPLPVASTFIRSPARKGVVHTEAVMGRG